MRMKTACPESSEPRIPGGPQSKTRLIVLSLLALVVIMSGIMSCDDDTDPVLEAPKQLDGSWQITQVFRNEVDITGSIDVSKFRITFGGDGTYSIENYLPFIVRSNGKFSLDDPQYPFNITFREDATQETLSTGITYPVVRGKRQIHLSFSPGCVNNVYEYVLEEAQ
jgi:hypothetical protein